jgi:lysophospholipase L1-like esterase
VAPKIFVLALLALGTSAVAQEFHLKDGDRVVFYGDSITDQRLYTTFTETFALTRFPQRKIAFVHSGWGGDRVTGGGGGGIDERLARDVFAYNPTVVTIMLGMNDGRYRAFDQQIFDIYSNGYRNIIKKLKNELPSVRITAIQPSPFDDVTQDPRFPGGYNEVLLRYAQFIQELAGAEKLTVADLNRPVTAMLAKAKGESLDNSRKIIPDRVHPGASGHLIMAAGLLKAWNAPAVVSMVEMDASSKKLVKHENTAVTDLNFGTTIMWTQKDEALPMPVDFRDPVMALAVRSSDFQETLNRQILAVDGLVSGKYTLRIDGSEVGQFDYDDLADGVNISGLRTPMWEQAARVHAFTLKHNNVHFARWRSLQVPLAPEHPETMAASLSAMDTLEQELITRQRQLAQPVAHKFELVRGETAFQRLFNGRDLEGWHVSKTSPHGQTQGWIVENGALTGTQDKPKNGGILLTDKSYQNFEVQLEINPDYGCDSGLFLRSTEKGEAYQVLLDYLDGGIIGGVYGEGLKGVQTFAPNWSEWYRRGEWNHLRARIEGDVPHIQTWLNGVKITDWTDTANHLPGGATAGMVAVQVHGGNSWVPGGKHRFRNISIRELP